MSGVIRGYDRASMLDLAIVCGGCADCAMELCLANDVSLTDTVEVGREYYTGTVSETDPGNLRHISEEGIRPATAITGRDMSECPYGGIGMMGIETDFVVG